MRKYSPFVQVMPYILLSDGGISDPAKLIIPNEEDIKLLRKKADEFRTVAYDIAAYLYDITIESQNILLNFRSYQLAASFFR